MAFTRKLLRFLYSRTSIQLVVNFFVKLSDHIRHRLYFNLHSSRCESANKRREIYCIETLVARECSVSISAWNKYSIGGRTWSRGMWSGGIGGSRHARDPTISQLIARTVKIVCNPGGRRDNFFCRRLLLSSLACNCGAEQRRQGIRLALGAGPRVSGTSRFVGLFFSLLS